jgi:hypothetical protein
MMHYLSWIVVSLTDDDDDNDNDGDDDALMICTVNRRCSLKKC